MSAPGSRGADDAGDDLASRVEGLFEEMIAQQRARLLSLARGLDPTLCGDDLLSPDDFPAIARDPRFNFEDGVLAGLISARTAVRARILLPRRDGDGA